MNNRLAPLKILYAVSEAQPLIKTGGLADVAGNLIQALKRLRQDVRLIIPGYPQAVERAIPLRPVATLTITGAEEQVSLLEGEIGGVPLYLVDAPGYFNRPGNPYTSPNGNNWKDNPERFALFCRTIVSLALGRTEVQWQPDLVHCNDWQTGLVPALLAQEWNRPATLFTIHNMAYQGLYDPGVMNRLMLPDSLWSPDGLEFYGQFSFIKGGLAFADWINTVSPTYAKEILTPAFGFGLEGLLNHKRDRLTGILQGIDYDVWDPSTDPAIPQHYDAATFRLKKVNKLKLQQLLGLQEEDKSLLLGYIGPLVEQKGVDLILETVPDLMKKKKIQMVILGSGDAGLERALTEISELHPGRVAVQIGFDESLAHHIEAACDCLLMPSKFEPCGSNQLHSLRYGTVPIVHGTGGLADTVVNATPENLLSGTATGFVFDQPDATSLWKSMEQAVILYERPAIWWEKLAVNGMKQIFSWEKSASQYIELYAKALENPAPNPVATARSS